MMFGAKCSNCGQIEYTIEDIQNETIEGIFIEYVICPKCKNKIVLNEIDLSKPYVESETALHCLACGELLTKRIDKIDGFSWLYCKKCEAKYNEKS